MRLNRLLPLLLFLLVIGCKNYYNDTIEWADNIEKGTSLKKVKVNQPDFFKVDWDNPELVGDEKRFLIQDIKGNKDILGTGNSLVFFDDKYVG